MITNPAGVDYPPAVGQDGQDSGGHPAPGAGRICSFIDCHRHVRPEWAVCDNHAAALLTQAFGRPVEGLTRRHVYPRTPPSSALPPVARTPGQPIPVEDTRLGRPATE